MNDARRFDLIRSLRLPDFLTLANGACGVIAFFQAIHFVEDKDVRHLWIASMLLPVALVLDFFDGRVARSRQGSSLLGRELDSLADLLSFGAAPAVIAYAVGLRTVLDQVVLVYFTLAGLARLARYNVTAEELAGRQGKVRYYEGTPIPTSVVPLGITVGAFATDTVAPVQLLGMTLHWPSFLFALSGSLMISKRLRIPKP
ncbi:MAG: CDP-diacylglycerol--serine O-phosphatidyltransferase [Candidatus Binatia bacterium]|nr:MAG: CDP-diacylglycerol--serine O-phosphatidyltransferase [Candidatus Binatia bacterium]